MGLPSWFGVLVISVVLQSTLCSENSHVINKEYLDGIINHVNSAGALWEAGHNFDDVDHSLIQKLVGTEYSAEYAEEIMQIDHIHEHLPNMVPHEVKHLKEFNGLKEWHYCPSVKKVKNQGRCAADWAMAPVSVISDRICIYYNGTKSVELSPHEPLSCCKTCGWGCRKGYPQMVYKQYVTKGLVTGGSYNSKKGCQPYEIKPCKGNIKKCFMQENSETPKCKPYCYNSKYKTKYSDDRHKGQVAFRLSCPYCAAGAMSRHGPLSATMKVYEDFLTYKNGVYHHVTGKALGYLTVKLVGFNDTIDKQEYWIAVNSWGKKWGDKGMFKIRRVTDECMIEGSLQGILVKDVPDKSSEEEEENVV